MADSRQRDTTHSHMHAFVWRALLLYYSKIYENDFSSSICAVRCVLCVCAFSTVANVLARKIAEQKLCSCLLYDFHVSILLTFFFLFSLSG